MLYRPAFENLPGTTKAASIEFLAIGRLAKWRVRTVLRGKQFPPPGAVRAALRIDSSNKLPRPTDAERSIPKRYWTIGPRHSVMHDGELRHPLRSPLPQNPIPTNKSGSRFVPY